ncbi:MAG: acetate kinase [candidate division SR1 bacterium]|nr:MAG: acetate kinase [candidate division SR1 bacterium]
MKILVLNSGSSSLKYQLFNMENQEVLAKGLVERIGIEGSKIKHKTASGEKHDIEGQLANHEVALHQVLDLLVHPDFGALKSLEEINAIGHRMVHGGESFKSSVLITEEVKAEFRKLTELAPLHNPANLMGVEACEKILPQVPNVGVFDTAFHQTMKPEHFLYALPYRWYEDHKVRRYGFHGTSHKYVSQRLAELMGRSDLKIITCHVGNGASITAIKNGEVVETSMGLTPLEGLMMGTRCGNIDPAIIPFMMKKEKLTAEAMDTLMNKESGILGLLGTSSDHREVEDGYLAGKEKETMIMEMYTNSILKYIGSYAALLGGVDSIVFTAGVLENSSVQRKLLAERLAWLGVDFDESSNNFRGEERKLTKEGSKVQLWVIPTDEELMIAQDTYELTK